MSSEGGKLLQCTGLWLLPSMEGYVPLAGGEDQ